MEETVKKENKKEPKVVVFGNEVGENGNEECCDEKDSQFGRHFHFHRPHRHGSFTWGLFFVLIGILFLLSNFGSLPPIVWSQVTHLWPVLLILIGLDTLLGHSDVSDFISSLLGLSIFATVLGVVFLNVAPNLLNGLPVGIYNYLHSISLYLQLK